MSSTVLDRLRKKRGSPIEIDGEVFHVRSLTIGEMKRLNELNDTDKASFAIGCALVNADGSQVIEQRQGDQTDSQWAADVAKHLEDVPGSTVLALNDGIARLIRPVKPETVAKN